jgi:hypothetical protein
MKKSILKWTLWANLRIHYVFFAGSALLILMLFGCATTPEKPSVPPTIKINTIPTGADISVDGNYIGQSPVTIKKPPKRYLDRGGSGRNVSGRIVDQPIIIEVALKGYETKKVPLGVYHPPEDRIFKDLLSGNMASKTYPAYYQFNDDEVEQITIKLSAK